MDTTKKESTPWLNEAGKRIQEEAKAKGLRGVRFFAMDGNDASPDDIARSYCAFEEAVKNEKSRVVTGKHL